MKNVDIAVVSDLHCQPKDHEPQCSFLHSDGPRVPKSHHPIAALLELIEAEKLRSAVLVAPGDFTDRANEAGFHAAWFMVQEVAEALEAEVVIPTLGNHDIDSRLQTGFESPFELAKTLHETFLFRDRRINTDYWAHGVAALSVSGMYVVVINSVAGHYTVESALHGGVTDAQLSRVRELLRENEEGERLVAICHHHPIQHQGLSTGDSDLMVNGERLIEILSQGRAALVIHGHKHYPRLRYAAGGGDPVPVFAAGSLSAFSGPLLSTTRNTFHTVTFTENPPVGCTRAGIIDTWEFGLRYGWRRGHRQSTDFPPVTGFGFQGVVGSLAGDCAEVLRKSGSDEVSWNRVIAAVPALSYLVPDQFDALDAYLLKHEGLTIVPKGGIPERLGRLI